MNWINKSKMCFFMINLCFLLVGCASMGQLAKMGPDEVAQAFIDDLQAGKESKAYALLTKGQSQHTSFDDFKEVLLSLTEKMGKIQDNETALMPFHKPAYDGNFIPLRTAPGQVKRYTYILKFGNASINCDLTIVPEDEQYKIAWFSFWK